MTLLLGPYATHNEMSPPRRMPGATHRWACCACCVVLWLVVAVAATACAPILGEYEVQDGSCAEVGEECTDDGDCCSSDTRPRHCVETASGRLCADGCEHGSQCASTCCASLQGSELVCAGLSACEACLEVNTPCAQHGDCCNYRLDLGYCVNMSSGSVCADSCTANSDCVSDCCASLEGGGAVCAPSTNC